MTRQIHVTAAWLCLVITIVIAQGQDPKWSRQLDGVESTETDSLDWVPLAQPLDGSKDRSANGRVLTYSQTFPPHARFGELPKAPQTSGGAFDYPFQFSRYPGGVGQAQALRSGPPPPSPVLKTHVGAQEPTSQSFFKFEMPFHSESGASLRSGAQAPPTLQTGYQIQHSAFGAAPASLFGGSTLFGQPPQAQHQQAPPPVQFPPEFHSVPQKHKSSLHQQNYVDDILPVKSHAKPLPTQPSLQSVTPQVFPLDPEPESIFHLKKPAQSPIQSGNGQQQQQQEVQLLYVPYDTLYNQQRQQQPQQQQPSSGAGAGITGNYAVNKYNVNAGLPAVNPYQINQFYTQEPSLSADFFNGATTSRPRTTTSSHPQNVFESFAQPQTHFTTAKPKPKAHQPPLAMFLFRSNSRPTQSDVVAALRNARTISVIDAPTKQTPDIFVGPAGMPIPEGFVKFDLPYLSQLAHTRDLNDVSFFVAPLSYRTPNGFNKILLPEPHVGSIVVNRAKDGGALELTQTQPQSVRQQRPLTTTTTTTATSSTSSTRNPFETTTQRINANPGAPGRGNKFSYFYVQDPIQEVSSPKIPKQERPKKKRPQSVQIEQPTYRPPSPPQSPPVKSAFDTINQIGINSDNFFSSLTNKPSTSSTSTSSTSTSTTSTTTSTTAAPNNLFTYSTRPQVEFPSSNGQLYHQFETSDPTRPPSSSDEEELSMKQYFRQQDAFRQQRPTPTTNSPYEQIQYSPVAVDYERNAAIPTTTQNINSKGKQRVTIYTPVTSSDVGYTVEPQKQPLPANHRPNYNQNEVLDGGNLEYEPNPYHVPSELPPLTPDIPGLVNNLQEKDKLPATTTPLNEPETRPTRRPVLRTRKPAVSKVVTSSVSYSESESNGKLPTHRIRRPHGGNHNGDGEVTTRRPTTSRNPLIRNPNRIRYQPTNDERSSFKIKPKKNYSGSKKNSNNKNESDQDLEYQRDVLKQNYPVFKGQRRPTSPTAIPSSYDVGTTEGPASESQQVYTVTPSNSIDNSEQDTFPANLLEPMQIAQHYNDFSKDNYGPGYFPNQEDLNPTEAIVRNEVSPIYKVSVASTTPSTTTTTTTTRSTTQATTTEAPPTTTTRRSPFLRRNYPRIRTTTTTDSPLTTTTVTPEERPSLRARIPPRRVIKVRQRTRRPQHPASSTTEPEIEAEPTTTPKSNLRKLSRYNQEQRVDKEVTPPRRRYKQPFQLEGQESQWAPAAENDANQSFKPLNPKDATVTGTHSFENEPEIVTVGPTQQVDTYEFNVAANLDGSAPQVNQRTTLKAPNLKPEKSFAELLEEVMGKAPEDLATDSPNTSTTSGRINRRGKWKKNRLSGGSENNNNNNENFETAESQNLGPQLFNAIRTNDKPDENIKSTTPLAATTTTEMLTTTEASPTTPEEYDLSAIRTTEFSPETTSITTTSTTTISPTTETIERESATRRMDTEADADIDVDVEDLDTQPSIFSEVKKQLHDLFAIDENEDQAATAAIAAVGRRRQEYTSIKRTKPTTDSSAEATTEGIIASTTEPAPTRGKDKDKSKDNFHKDLMEHVVYATSTSTKVTSETEICYRGRCIRSEDLPSNHKLH